MTLVPCAVRTAVHRSWRSWTLRTEYDTYSPLRHKNLPSKRTIGSQALALAHASRGAGLRLARRSEGVAGKREVRGAIHSNPTSPRDDRRFSDNPVADGASGDV